MDMSGRPHGPYTVKNRSPVCWCREISSGVNRRKVNMEERGERIMKSKLEMIELTMWMPYLREYARASTSFDSFVAAYMFAGTSECVLIAERQ
jgi:hypothetical protein